MIKRVLTIPPPDARIQRDASKPKSLRSGLLALDNLWGKGVHFTDIYPHFFITWLAYANANVVLMARMLKVHRNKLVLNFRERVKRKSTVKLRRAWNEIAINKPKASFHDRVKILYDGQSLKPTMSGEQNTALVNLWLMGFPQFAIRLHAYSFLVRKRVKTPEMAKKLKRENRSFARYRKRILSPRFKKWFEPLGMTKQDWFIRRVR